MPRFSSILVFLLTFAPAPARANTPLTCVHEGTASTIRLDGAAELLSDVVLACTGGRPTPEGQRVPEYQILLTANLPLLSRVLYTPPPGEWPFTEALLLLDDPAPEDQLPCAPRLPGDSCARFGNEPGPNIFQARQVQDNALIFSNIPIDPPGDGAVRRIRITNLRARPSALPPVPGAPPQVVTTLQIFDWSGGGVPLAEPAAPNAIALPAATFSVLDHTGAPPASGRPALLTTPSLISRTDPRPSSGFRVRFTESFASAFRRRNVATSGADPAFVIAQSIPGFPYRTESGFHSDDFPDFRGLASGGLAESGTRLRVVFHDIPKGIQVWVSTRDLDPDGAAASDSPPRALLTYTDSFGAGPFSYMNPWLPEGYAQLYIDNASASATWEVVSADPFAIEDFTFSVALTAQGGTPATGVSTLTATLAPLAGGETPSAPSFLVLPPPEGEDPPDPLPSFSIVNTVPGARVTVTSAAPGGGAQVAPASLARVNAPGLALAPAAQPEDPPLSLAGVTVSLIDSIGVLRPARIVSVDGDNIVILLPDTLRTGSVIVAVTASGRPAGTGILTVTPLAPGLFTASGAPLGPALGEAITTGAGEPVATPLAVLDDESGLWRAVPISLEPGEPGPLLRLYGTGWRALNDSGYLYAEVGGIPVPVIHSGAHPSLPGVDEITLGPIPAALQGRGSTHVQVSFEGRPANRVTVVFD